MSINIENVHWTIRDLHRQITDYRITGYESFEYKKDLYQIKFSVDHALKNSPTFEGEQEWLDDLQKRQIVNIIKSV